LEQGILGAEDHPHPTPAELGIQPVAPVEQRAASNHCLLYALKLQKQTNFA
jgi:hypothetical protein